MTHFHSVITYLTLLVIICPCAFLSLLCYTPHHHSLYSHGDGTTFHLYTCICKWVYDYMFLEFVSSTRLNLLDLCHKHTLDKLIYILYILSLCVFILFFLSGSRLVIRLKHIPIFTFHIFLSLLSLMH